MNSVFSRMSLLWKILLSTSVALTTLFAVTLAIVQRHVVRTTYRTLQEEVNRSFQVYDSLWKAQAEKLAAIGLVLSRMSDVRSAFTLRRRAKAIISWEDAGGQFAIPPANCGLPSPIRRRCFWSVILRAT